MLRTRIAVEIFYIFSCFCLGHVGWSLSNQLIRFNLHQVSMKLACITPKTNKFASRTGGNAMKVLLLRLGAYVVGAFALLLSIPSAYAIAPVATINGCYDCVTYDTPSLQINNTTGGTLSNAQMVLHGYQGDNYGLTLAVPLGDLGAGSTTFTWGSLPGVDGSTSPFSLSAYDYDDEFIGTAYAINDPTCGGGGCVGSDAYYAQVGNFAVTFTAIVSGGLYNGDSVYSVFSPANNATGSFVGWEGLTPSGYSESFLYDVHVGSFSGTLADIYLGTPPAAGVPEPDSFWMLVGGLWMIGLLGWLSGKHKRLS